MALPASPTNGQQAIANGILYTYDATKNAWNRTSAGNISVTGNVTAGGNVTAAAYFWSNGTPLSTGGASTYGNTEVAAYLPTNSTIIDLYSNAATQATSINTINANLGAYQIYANANIGTATTNINSINANLGAYQTFANSNAATQATSINTINANLGAYQIYANANLGTATTNINSIQANLGAYQIYANANIGTIRTNLNTLDANVGAYQTFANSNAATQATSLNAINANIGAFITYANTKIGDNSNGNLVVQSTTESISPTTGALVVRGGAGIQGNLFVNGNLYASNLISIAASTLTVQDPLLYLTANTVTPYNYDIGFYSQFVGGSNNNYQHTGFVRDYSTDTWRLFSNVVSEPGTVINWSDSSLVYDTLTVGKINAANTTPATSTATGALVISGGAGIAGNVYADKVYATNGIFWNNGVAYGGNLSSTSASTFDNAIARFDGTTGKLVQGSAVAISDTGQLTINVLPQDPNETIVAYNNDPTGSFVIVKTDDGSEAAFELRTGSNISGLSLNAASRITTVYSAYDFNISPTGNTNVLSPLYVNSGIYWYGNGQSYTSNFVVGPASSISNTIPVFDGVTGKLVKDSGIEITNNGQTLILNGATDPAISYGYDANTSAFAMQGAVGSSILMGTTSSSFGGWIEATDSQLIVESSTGALRLYSAVGDVQLKLDIDGIAKIGTSSVDFYEFTHDNFTLKPNAITGDSPGIRFEHQTFSTTEYQIIKPNPDFSTTTIWYLPEMDGTDGQVLKTNGSGYLSWVDAGSGNVSSSTTSTDNAIARFDGTSGTLIQDSTVLIGDDGNVVITSATISSSVTTGALVVGGGVGVAGELYIANTGDVSANIGTVINNFAVLDANIGEYQTYANSNSAILATGIDSISANLGEYQTYANANAATLATSIDSIDANLGAYQTYANANASTQATSINSINANLGAYQTYANANLGTATTNISSIQANLGSYQIFANANAATQATSLNSINANIGAFYTYANSKIGTNNNSNLVVNATTTSTSATTGALVVRGGVGVAGNVYADKFYTTTGLYWAGNGVAFSSGAGGLIYTTSGTAPVSPDAGDFWYDTSSNILFQYTDDSVSQYWLDIQGVVLGSGSGASPGGSGTPSGADTQIQFNDGGTFGGAGNLSYYKANGNVVLSTVTSSISSTTGALVVTGGVGIGGNVYVNRVYTATGLYWSGNGFPINTGGGGGSTPVGGQYEIQFNVGGSLAADANLKFDQSTGNLVVGSNTASSSKTTGAVVVRGGAGVTGNVYTGAVYADTGIYWSGNNQPILGFDPAFSIYDWGSITEPVSGAANQLDFGTL